MEWIETFIKSNETLIWGMGIFSLVIFVVSLVALPMILINLPTDYLVHPERPERHGLVKKILPNDTLYRVVKNLLAAVLLLGGLAMLVLPGQGILTIAVALALFDFPGKPDMIRRIVCHKRVLDSANWVRGKADKPPLTPPEESGAC